MFNFVQLFYLDSSSVKGALEAGISGIDLWFKAKPKAVGNRSNIVSPGVEVSIVPCVNGVPIINEVGTIRPPEPTEHGARFNHRSEIARKEWGEIIATEDASSPTRFRFDNPIFLKTKQEYGILVKFDGHEDFLLWENTQKERIIGTTTIAPLPDKSSGALYQYIGPAVPNIDNLTSPYVFDPSPTTINFETNQNTPTVAPDAEYMRNNWKAVSNAVLKYTVYVARYAHGGVPVSVNAVANAIPEYSQRFNTGIAPVRLANNIIRMTSPGETQEYIAFDARRSTMGTILAGDKLFQQGINYPGGKLTPLTVSVQAGNNIVTANANYIMNGNVTFQAANGFYNIYNDDNSIKEYIVVVNGSNVAVKQIDSIVSSTQLTIKGIFATSNNAAYFYRAPVGELIGISDTYALGSKDDLLILANTNANSSVRFVNNTITVISGGGGTGYSNTDYLTVSGFENIVPQVQGGYPAKANLVTNATGGIVSVYLSNAGCGFINTAWLTGANVVVSNTTGGTSSGTGAAFTYTIDAVIRAELNANANFVNCSIINLEASRLKPEITVNNPLGTAFTVTHRSLFYSVDDTTVSSKKAFYISGNVAATDITVKIFKSHDTGKEENRASVVPSRSNQFVIPYANGTFGNTAVIGKDYSNAAVYFFDMFANNDYLMPFFEPNIINSHYSKYVINNDYTNEHTNYGNAYAKHITTKVNMNNDNNLQREAEDILSYLTAYRPAGTDFKVYARIHNTKDADAFDDKDWSLLEQIDGASAFSSKVDSSDYYEYTYNFPNAPNTDLTLAGTASVANVTTTIVSGAGTTFTTDLIAGDLVKISQPLFSNTNFAVAVVNAVTNSSQIIIGNPLANNGLVGTGLLIERIRTYKYQAFNNVLNSNIVKYYNLQMSEFNNYDTFQLKMVMLSNNQTIVPKIDDVRGISVSA